MSERLTCLADALVIAEMADLATTTQLVRARDALGHLELAPALAWVPDAINDELARRGHKED